MRVDIFWERVGFVEHESGGTMFWMGQESDHPALYVATGPEVRTASSGFKYVINSAIRTVQFEGDKDPWNTMLSLCQSLNNWKEVTDLLQMESVL